MPRTWSGAEHSMLFKNVLKTLATKWMQLAAIGVIVVLSSLIYSMMFYGLSGIAEPTTSYLEEYNQEDFAVEMLSVITPAEAQYPAMRGLVAQGKYSLVDIRRAEPATFQRLMEGRIKAFEDLYPGVSLELRRFKVVDFERNRRAHTALLARDAEQINRTFIEAGSRPVDDDEVALNRIYAQKNGIEIGDYFEMRGQRYRVTGFVLFPDYTLTTFDNSFNIDTGLQPLVLLSNAGYDDVDVEEKFRLAGVTAPGQTVDTEFDSDLLPWVTQIIPTDINMRSGAIYDELTQGRTTSLGLSIFIAGIAVIIVAIMMSNLLNAERGQIGILKAMGYRRVEIALPYFVSVVAMAFVMLIIGYLLGTMAAEPLKRMYLDFYLLPQIDIVQRPSAFVAAIFVPLLFFAGSCGIVIYRLLGEGPLELFKPRDTEALNVLTRVVSGMLRNAKGVTKFKYLHAVRNTGSFVVFFVGMMFATLLITFAFMMNGMVDRMTVGSLGDVGYEYQAFVDPDKRAPEPRPGDEKFLTYPYGYVGTRSVSLQGVAPDNVLYQLRDSSGRNITGRLRHDVVISQSLGLKLGLGEGDQVQVRVDSEVHELTVAGVADDFSADTIYLDIKRLSSIVSEGRTTELYTGIYSIEKPSAAFYATIISKQALLDQATSMATYTSLMINVMISASAVIAGSILFVLTAFTVERNYYTISLLKVLGYSRREVNSMILDSYFVYSFISYALSVPIALGILGLLEQVFLTEYGIVVPLQYNPVDLLKGLVVLVVVFLVGTYASRVKIARIPLQEVLKTYGE